MSKKATFLRVTISLALALSLFLTACGKKTALTAEEFNSLVKKEGFIIADDAAGRFSDGVTTAIQAIDPGGKFVIEFYIFSSTDKAKDASGVINNSLQGLSGTKVTNSFTGYYRITSKGMFYFASRVENTLVYVETDESNKDALSKTLKTLGYW